jgi:hypothetical protein
VLPDATTLGFSSRNSYFVHVVRHPRTSLPEVDVAALALKVYQAMMFHPPTQLCKFERDALLMLQRNGCKKSREKLLNTRYSLHAIVIILLLLFCFHLRTPEVLFHSFRDNSRTFGSSLLGHIFLNTQGLHWRIWLRLCARARCAPAPAIALGPSPIITNVKSARRTHATISADRTCSTHRVTWKSQRNVIWSADNHQLPLRGYGGDGL